VLLVLGAYTLLFVMFGLFPRGRRLDQVKKSPELLPAARLTRP